MATATMKQILIIEDDKDIAESLKLLLEDSGHMVRVAYDGLAGYQTATELLPDIVLSDIGLPGLDGFEVARALRRTPATAEALLIAISAQGQDEDVREMAEASGFDYVLAKPAEPAVLLKLF